MSKFSNLHKLMTGYQGDKTGLATASLPFKLVTQGNYFGVSKILTVPASSVDYFVTRLNANSVVGILSFIANGPFTVEIFASPDISANGTEDTINNFNFASANTPTAQIFESPTLNSEGAKVSEYLLPGTKGKTGIGAGTGDFIPFVLPAESDFLVKIINDDGAQSHRFNYQFNFFEFDPSDPNLNL